MGAAIFSQVRLFNMHPTGGMHARERLQAAMGQAASRIAPTRKICESLPKKFRLPNRSPKSTARRGNSPAGLADRVNSHSSHDLGRLHAPSPRHFSPYRCYSAGNKRFCPHDSGDDISTRAHKLHFPSFVIDTHDDTTQRLFSKDYDLGKRNWPRRHRHPANARKVA